MNIHAYFLCYNEQDIIRFTIEHYKKFCSKIFILDNMSTDNSVSIAKEYSDVYVEQWTSNNSMNDLEHIKIKLEAYKRFSMSGSPECVEPADWVITADMDEFLYHKDIISVLESYETDSATVANIVGFNMVSSNWPKEGIPIVSQIKDGFRHDVFDKPILFKTSFNMKFSVGCHPGGEEYEQMKNQENFKFGSEPIALLHYKHIGDRNILKAKVNASRLSEVNIKNKWGAHYLLTDEQFDRRTNYVREIARPILGENGEIYFDHNNIN